MELRFIAHHCLHSYLFAEQSIYARYVDRPRRCHFRLLHHLMLPLLILEIAPSLPKNGLSVPSFALMAVLQKVLVDPGGEEDPEMQVEAKNLGKTV